MTASVTKENMTTKVAMEASIKRAERRMTEVMKKELKAEMATRAEIAELRDLLLKLRDLLAELTSDGGVD